MLKPSPPAITLAVPDRDGAQRQFWRHVANRACLSILADARYPLESARSSSDQTRPPQGPPRPQVGSDMFKVKVESIQITIGNDKPLLTAPLMLKMLVNPTGDGNRLTLATLRDWPTPKTSDPLFRYRSDRRILERRDGLSGDMVYLFEMLLTPHARELLKALTLPLCQGP